MCLACSVHTLSVMKTSNSSDSMRSVGCDNKVLLPGVCCREKNALRRWWRTKSVSQHGLHHIAELHNDSPISPRSAAGIRSRMCIYRRENDRTTKKRQLHNHLTSHNESKPPLYRHYLHLHEARQRPQHRHHNGMNGMISMNVDMEDLLTKDLQVFTASNPISATTRRHHSYMGRVAPNCPKEQRRCRETLCRTTPPSSWQDI